MIDAQTMLLACSVNLDHHLGYGLHGSFKYADPPKNTDEEVIKQKTGFSVTIKNTGQRIENIKAGTKLRSALL